MGVSLYFQSSFSPISSPCYKNYSENTTKGSIQFWINRVSSIPVKLVALETVVKLSHDVNGLLWGLHHVVKLRVQLCVRVQGARDWAHTLHIVVNWHHCSLGLLINIKLWDELNWTYNYAQAEINKTQNGEKEHWMLNFTSTLSLSYSLIKLLFLNLDWLVQTSSIQTF